LIIDASVAFKWIVAEDDSSTAIEWIGRTELVAPALIHVEVANALWKRLMRGEFAIGAEISEQLESLASLVRTIDETPMVPRAAQLGAELAHPIYDCVYLAVAEAYDDVLLTADPGFLKKVVTTPHAGRVKELSAWPG
jgi:predicted nucleic acid-binding protein